MAEHANFLQVGRSIMFEDVLKVTVRMPCTVQEVTVRDYLFNLLALVWEDKEGFDGKRPFGTSGWEWDILHALVQAGIIEADLDEDGDIENVTDEEGELFELVIAGTINYLRNGG